MWSVALLNLPDEGAQASLHVIDLKQGPQLLVGLLLLHAEGLGDLAVRPDVAILRHVCRGNPVVWRFVEVVAQLPELGQVVPLGARRFVEMMSRSYRSKIAPCVIRSLGFSFASSSAHFSLAKLKSVPSGNPRHDNQLKLPSSRMRLLAQSQEKLGGKPSCQGGFAPRPLLFRQVFPGS